MEEIIFVIGSTRSGTSAIRNALCKTRFKGAGEGHTIGLIQSIDDQILRYYREKTNATRQGTFLSKIDPSSLMQGICAVFANLYSEIAGSEYIVDKTPTIEPVNSLTLISKYWPEAKIIFCRRRGIDNIMSKMRKFPDVAFDAHCIEWTAIIDAWDNRRTELRLDWLEIDHYDLLHNPSETATRIASFVGLTNEEEGLMARYFCSERPEKTSSHDSDVALDSSGWSSEQVASFLRICGTAMARCGYGLNTHWNDEK